jgi:sugar/nucleoside kinase (ribokinase family)
MPLKKPSARSTTDKIMARYQVYAVGNALVDKEFEVDDSFFEKHNIEKGLMTLVDHAQQDHLLSLLTEKYGVKKQAGGGSAGNTLYALSQFGAEAYFACKVAMTTLAIFTWTNSGITISIPILAAAKTVRPGAAW